MRPNENIIKDLSYQQMIYNKLLVLDGMMANYNPYTNLYHEVLEGGTRYREHPLPGISMATFEPSTLAVSSSRNGDRNTDEFLNNLSKSRPQIQRPSRPVMKNATNASIPLTAGSLNNRMEIVKKVMKEQGLTLGKASKFVKDNNLYKKIDKVVGAGNKSKKISRIKKGKKWRDFTADTINMGLDLGQKGLDMYNKQKDRQIDKAKDSFMGLFGKGMEGSGNKSGKISRIKKGKKWRDFSADTINMGMDLGQKGLDMYNKQKDRQIDKAKDSIMGLFGKGMEGGKRPPSKWILYVKKYASDNNISYKDALKKAGASYKNSK